MLHLWKISCEKILGQFKCYGENTERYKNFLIPIKKEIRKVNKDGNEYMITILQNKIY